jgi:hypothetical protein
MHHKHRSFPDLKGAIGSSALAVLLGVSAALFTDGYWLSRLFPAGSRQLLLLTVLIAAGCAVGYALLLRWFRRALHGFDRAEAAILLLASALIGTFTFFGGTAQWLRPGNYLVFLLPKHSLTISATPSAGAGAAAVTWFNTSVGDISFDALGSKGWVREGEELRLADGGQNELAWGGVTGDRAQLVLQSTKAGVGVDIVWDGAAQSVILQKGKNTYERAFPVPFYASGGMINLLGLINFIVLSVLLVLLTRARWPAWRAEMGKSIKSGAGMAQRRDLLAILGLTLAALLLRAFNLGAVFPAVDEYYHLIAARQLVQGAALSAVYERGLWLVTVPISEAFRIFGFQVWAARLTGAIFNSLAIIPLYVLTRRINRPIAVLSCAIYAISPWIVTFGRVAREYAFYPFYFYWIVYLMVLLVAAIPSGFVARRDWRTIARPRVLLLTAVLAFPPYFGLVTDWLSTFRTILIAYVVFGAAVLTRFKWSERSNWPVLGALGVALVYGARASYGEQASKLLVLPRFNPIPLEYFLPNPQQQWYFDRLVVIIALALVAAAIYAWTVRRDSFIPAFFLGLFGTYLVVFALFSRTFFHTRHLLTTELWFVVVCAIGMFAFWIALTAVVPLGTKASRVAVVAVLAIGLTNMPQVLLPTLSTNPDMPISEDYLHDMSEVQALMLRYARSDDVLISTVYGLYASWKDVPQFRSQYRITSATPLDEILKIVDQNPSGWIVIDKIRLDLSAFSSRDLSRVQQIEYIGAFGDEYVWHWQRSRGGAGAAPGAN